MKKTYIEPQCTVVAVNTETMVCVSGKINDAVTIQNRDEIGAREVLISDETTIIARGAWETWE